MRDAVRKKLMMNKFLLLSLSVCLLLLSKCNQKLFPKFIIYWNI